MEDIRSLLRDIKEAVDDIEDEVEDESTVSRDQGRVRGSNRLRGWTWKTSAACRGHQKRWLTSKTRSGEEHGLDESKIKDQVPYKGWTWKT